MKTVQVRNSIIGEGKPKICVPIVGTNAEEIIKEAKNIAGMPVDVTEWRADWFEDVFETEKVLDMAEKLREILGDMPILFTFRTLKEGGEKEIGQEEYASLIKNVILGGSIDLVDVEVFMGDELVKEIIAFAHEHEVKVIASNHDFKKTPSCDDLIYRMRKMQDFGADIPKIAVMPQTKTDVATLLLATAIMHEKYAKTPIITMSMKGTGMISRLAGESFGSALTFGTVTKASAPGQIPVKELDETLTLIHDCMK